MARLRIPHDIEPNSPLGIRPDEGGTFLGPQLPAAPRPGPGPGGEPESNILPPIALNPGKTPRRPGGTPPQPQEPRVEAGPADRQAFAGGGSSTMSPPSVTQLQPFVSLSQPSPDSLVFPQGGGGGLMGIGGGQFGGGLGVSESVGGQEDPSSLILALLSLLSGGGGR